MIWKGAPIIIVSTKKTNTPNENPDPPDTGSIYPLCRSFLGGETWGRIVGDQQPEIVPDLLEEGTGEDDLPGFIPSLARLEWTLHRLAKARETIPKNVDQLRINPALHALGLSWRHLPSLINKPGDSSVPSPEPGEEVVLAWVDPSTGSTHVGAASDEDLLVLKMVSEGISIHQVAAMGQVLPAAVENAVGRAIGKGLLLSPPSRIRRDPVCFNIPENTDESFLSCPDFVLQWHVTQACDLHCKHCYDRSDRSPLQREKAFQILDDFQEFCLGRHVRGHICFTGGNPLLYPHFTEVYHGASDRGFLISILGNPTPRERITELLAIQPLEHFQISLEGLPEHNDDIRGTGHFARSIEFLGILKDLGVYSKVMLTLTRDNIDQVIPLADMLRGQADSFTFNRLSQVGEGANLKLPPLDSYVAFLQEYMDAADDNPVIRMKDNLFNILHYQRETGPFGGCTGFGCGAAFNFITLLADGEVHACRKFPSLIGNIYERKIADIYDSDIAGRYRSGSGACRGCSLRPMCGGCMAVVYSHGLNVFQDRDPYCFIDM